MRVYKDFNYIADFELFTFFTDNAKPLFDWFRSLFGT